MYRYSRFTVYATYSRMEQEIADLGKEIARLERQEALDAELRKPELESEIERCLKNG